MGVGAKVIDGADVVGCAVGAGIDSQVPSSATRTEISSPTRLQAQRLMFEAARRPAARLLGGLRSSSCSWWVEYSQRVGTQLYWNRWAAHGARRAARRCFSKKTIEVQRRRWLPARHAMSLRAGLGQVVLAPTGILNQSRCDAVGGDVVRGYSTALHIFYPLMVPRVSEARRRREALREPPQAL